MVKALLSRLWRSAWKSQTWTVESFMHLSWDICLLRRARCCAISRSRVFISHVPVSLPSGLFVPEGHQNKDPHLCLATHFPMQGWPFVSTIFPRCWRKKSMTNPDALTSDVLWSVLQEFGTWSRRRKICRLKRRIDQQRIDQQRSHQDATHAMKTSFLPKTWWMPSVSAGCQNWKKRMDRRPRF